MFALVIAGKFFLDNKHYYISAVVLMLLAAVPFFIKFGKKNVGARELTVMASIAAAAVASRAAFYALPQVKPMCAVIIIAASAFGGETGFMLGALSVFLSNFIFGQGLWTPFQMFGMALTAYLCGKLFYKTKLGKNKIAVSLLGGAICFAVYGFIVDLSSVFMMSADYSLKSVLAIFASGAPFNLIHGATTAVLLFIGYVPIMEKLERVRIKYALFGEKYE